MKRLIAFVLMVGVIIGITMLTMFGERIVKAGTNGYSRDAAVEWARSLIGTWNNYDGKGVGADCVDLAKMYFHVVGGMSDSEAKNIIGDAGSYVYDTPIPNGWQRFYVSDGATPQQGDIAVWEYGGYQYNYILKYGHVGIVVAIKGSSIEIVDQDSNKNRVAELNTYPWNQVKCFIRPDFIHLTNYANLGEDFYATILSKEHWKPISKVAENDKIYLKNENGTSRQVWRFKRQSDGSYIISSCFDGKALEMTDGIREAGKQITAQGEFWGGYYQQWFLVPKDGGYVFLSKHYPDVKWVMHNKDSSSADGNTIQIQKWNDSSSQIWSVYKDYDVQLTGPKLTVAFDSNSGENKFSWTRSYGASDYNLRIFKDELYTGKEYSQWNLKSTECSISNLPAGKYYAYVDAENYYIYKQSNIVTFTVTSQQENKKYSINLNWQLNGKDLDNSKDFATADVYINGQLIASGVTDYYDFWPAGTTYKFIVNEKKGYKKTEVVSGKESGTLGSENVECQFSIKSLHSLTVFGFIDGSLGTNTNTSTEGYGTFDVYINGKPVATDVTRYYNDSLEYGAQYSIENIKVADERGYSGVYTEDSLLGEVYYGKRKGIIDGNHAVGLKFFATYPGQVKPEYITATWNNHVYKYISKPYTWYEAKVYGKPLVTIDSAEEEQFLRSFTNNSSIWIGATDIATEGKWEWLSGNSFTYSNWKDGNPDNSTDNDEGCENYAVLGSDGKWKDACGYEKYGFVTETEIPVLGIVFGNPYSAMHGGDGHPENQTIVQGETATFAVYAMSTRTGRSYFGTELQYLWQYKETGMNNWEDWPYETGSELEIDYDYNRDGMKVRCVVSDPEFGDQVISNEAVLTCECDLMIIEHPVNTTVNENELSYFSIKAVGNGLEYLWQYKNAGASTWTDWTSKTTAAINVAYSVSRNGMSLRCVVTDSKGNKVISDAATLTYKSSLKITTQPESTTVNENELAYFNIKANGNGLKYLWQYQEKGKSTWTDWISMTAPAIGVPYDVSQNGMNVRCVITDSEGNQVVSDVATLTYTISYTDTPTASDEIERTGDIDGDGSITAKDVTILRRYLAGGWDVTVNLANADVNADGTINAKDVTMLRRYLAGGWGVVLT